jgi:hypothetical protein
MYVALDYKASRGSGRADELRWEQHFKILVARERE